MRYTSNNNRKVIASKCICNCIATVIYDIEYGINDKILVGEAVVDNGYTVPQWSVIRYNKKGEAYFNHFGRREYLSDYMRVN